MHLSVHVLDLISLYPFQTLKLEGYLTSRITDFSKIRAESLLPLERLELLHFEHGPHIGLTFSPHTFPNLSCLQIDGPFVAPPFKTIPWSNLRQLDWDCAQPLSLSEALAILRDVTTLERATMVLSIDIQPPLAGGVFAANLSAFHLRIGHTCNVGHFLDMLTAPKLKTLKLNDEYASESMECDMSVFQRLVASSRIEMEKLSISWATVPLSVGALLDCMPSLRRLELATYSILDEDSMKKIANGELGPRIEALSMHLRSVNPEVASSILTMIESRQDSARSETHGRISCFKQVLIGVVGMGQGYHYEELLGKLEGIVEFI